MKTVIMAGGRGTRIAQMAPDIPKPMIPLLGKPILEYQIECLTKHGLRDITIVVGHLGRVIMDHFGDGRRFGAAIQYYSETEPLGTAGALFKIAGELSDDFILLNGDIVFDIDFKRLIDFHRKNKALASLVTHPNSHPYDSAILQTDGVNRVIKWVNKEEPRLYYKNLVNSGIHVLTRRLLESAQPKSEKIDLDRDILKPLIPGGGIFSYRSPEYIRDMGTPDRYEQAGADIENGLVSRRSLSHPQKAVFLDRDGTINELRGFVRRPEDFVLIPGAAEAIGRINRAGYLAIVITNQPLIARGETTLEELGIIHDKMETELGKSGAYLDDIFFCPHHPDRGFPGERPEYKIDCECRKPKPGMILKAAEKYHIDPAQSYMAGDDKRDIGAALNSGCRPVLIRAGSPPGRELFEGREVPVFPGLLEFTAACLS
jgi:D-glycero-D-manno-heptose 1,7-bisphosphate phosphatase